MEKVDNISKILKIEDLLNRRPKELSGGQQQRVAIGRAIIKNPSLLLMDEPFSNLDAALRIEMREEIKNLQNKLKITTMFVTHDQEEALSISDRIILMNKGRLVQYSTARELYEYPNSMYSASFIGRPKINIISKDKVNILGLNCKEFKDNLEYTVLCIRPEDIFLTQDIGKYSCRIIKTINKGKSKETQCELNNIEGTIKSLILLGKDTYITVDVKGQDLKVIITGSCNFKIGQKIYIRFNKTYLFKE